jgi:hypothetical protein
LAIHQLLDVLNDPEHAQRDLLAAVREQYDTCKATNTKDALSHLCCLHDQENNPACVAFLAVSVIAAEAMEDRAYYSRLYELLGQKDDSSSGLNRQTFEACWFSLQKWLSDLDISIERPFESELRYISWPRKHVLLRSLDIRKLPNFFKEFECPLRRALNHNLIEALFDKWLSMSSCSLTPAGKSAWAKPNSRLAIIRQILRAWETWDGSERKTDRHITYIAGTKHTTTAMAWLELHRRELILCAESDCEQLPPCFGIKFGRWDGHAFVRFAKIPEAGRKSILSRGWHCETGTNMSFTARNVYPFTLSDSGPWLESKRDTSPILNQRSAILCKISDRDRIRTYIEQMSGIAPAGEPVCDEWILYSGFVPTVSIAPIFGMESLYASQDCRYRFVGGLKVGPNTWLTGMGPTSLKISNPHFSQIEVNGKAVQLTNDAVNLSAIIADSSIYKSDDYVFKIGEKVSIIRLVETTIKNDSLSAAYYQSPAFEDDQAADFCLPMGTWTLIGGSPEEVLTMNDRHTTNPTGCWQWAVGHNENRCPAVVSLTHRPDLPLSTRLSPSRKARQWAGAIMSAVHPQFGALSPAADRGSVRRVWLGYVSAAKRIRAEPISAPEFL